MTARYVIRANKYLKDPKTRAALVARSARSSSAVENIYVPDKGPADAVVTAKRDCVQFGHGSVSSDRFTTASKIPFSGR